MRTSINKTLKFPENKDFPTLCTGNFPTNFLKSGNFLKILMQREVC